MSLIDSFRAGLNNMINARQPATPLWVSEVEKIGRPPVYPQPLTQTYLNAFLTNASVYTIVSYMANKFGSVPRHACMVEDPQAAKAAKYILRSQKISFKSLEKLQRKAYGGTSIKPSISMLVGSPEQRLARLTERPNSTQGQDAYYAEVYLFQLLTGNTFIELNRGDVTGMTNEEIVKLPVLEKIVRPTQCIRIVPAKEDVNTVIEYKFDDLAGTIRSIPTVNMIHYKSLNPTYDGSMGTHLLGVSPLAAGLKLLTQDNSATDAAVSMQQNQGAKGLLVNESIKNPTPEQVQMMRDALNTNINSVSNKGAVGFLGGSSYNYMDMGQSSVDMQLLQSQENIFIRFCNLFGIPPAIFLTETSYANQEQAGKQFLTNKILPAACSFRDEENRIIIPSFDLDPMKYTTDIDATLMVELSEDTLQLSQQLANSPFMTLNEKREAMGQEPIEDPNFDKAYIANNLISVDDINVNDGLDSYSGMGDTNQSLGGLSDNQNTQTGNARNADNAHAGQSGSGKRV